MTVSSTTNGTKAFPSLLRDTSKRCGQCGRTGYFGASSTTPSTCPGANSPPMPTHWSQQLTPLPPANRSLPRPAHPRPLRATRPHPRRSHRIPPRCPSAGTRTPAMGSREDHARRRRTTRNTGLPRRATPSPRHTVTHPGLHSGKRHHQGPLGGMAWHVAPCRSRRAPCITPRRSCAVTASTGHDRHIECICRRTPQCYRGVRSRNSRVQRVRERGTFADLQR